MKFGVLKTFEAKLVPLCIYFFPVRVSQGLIFVRRFLYIFVYILRLCTLYCHKGGMLVWSRAQAMTLVASEIDEGGSNVAWSKRDNVRMSSWCGFQMKAEGGVGAGKRKRHVMYTRDWTCW